MKYSKKPVISQNSSVLKTCDFIIDLPELITGYVDGSEIKDFVHNRFSWILVAITCEKSSV
jgi:hypothetical protein